MKMLILEAGNLQREAKMRGHWAIARMLAKKNVPFDTTYNLLFGRQPRR